MKLIAKKPCSFGGEKFFIGDEIPTELVLDPKAQEKMGVLAIDTGVDEAKIAEGCADKEPVSAMTVYVHAEEGDLPLTLTTEGLQAFVDVITSNVKDAEKVVQQMIDGDALILLDLADSRKSIKDAAKTRAQQLNSEESAGEQ